MNIGLNPPSGLLWDLLPVFFYIPSITSIITMLIIEVAADVLGMNINTFGTNDFNRLVQVRAADRV